MNPLFYYLGCYQSHKSKIRRKDGGWKSHIMKHLILLPLFLCSISSFAQSTPRKDIKGEIHVPEGYEPEGIHIYNKSSGYGTSSDSAGSFEIPMGIGDTLHFSAVQFAALEVVITPEIIDAGKFSVEIREGLNELPEILIRSHELTGNVREDLDRIKVPQLPSFPSMQDLDKLEPEKMSPKNSVVNEIGGGANHLSLLIKGYRLLFPKRVKVKKPAPPQTQWSAYEQVVLEKDLRARFDDQFFLENFGVPVAEISAFVGFVAKNGFSRSLLNKDKEMELIQFLMGKSEDYMYEK